MEYMMYIQKNTWNIRHYIRNTWYMLINLVLWYKHGYILGLNVISYPLLVTAIVNLPMDRYNESTIVHKPWTNAALLGWPMAS